MVNIKCIKCQYQWDTKSKMKLVSCPSCLSKVRIDQDKGAKNDE